MQREIDATRATISTDLLVDREDTGRYPDRTPHDRECTMLHSSPPDLSSSLPTTSSWLAKSPVPSPRPRPKLSPNANTGLVSPSVIPSNQPTNPPSTLSLPSKPDTLSRRSRSKEEMKPPLTVEEEGRLSLNDFVLQYSTLLPLQMTVKKGYHGGDERYSIATDDVYNVHFVKRTKVVVLQDHRGATFNIPLNSAVQFAPVFNPNNDSREAMQGFTFERVSDIMSQKTLPKIVRATKAHVRVDPMATIEQFEVFIVHNIVPTGVRKRSLQVYSITCNKDKLLPTDSVGGFTTEPRLTCVFLPEIMEHFLNDLPLDVQVVMCDEDTGKEIPYYLTNEVATLTHVDSETSLIATTNWGKDEQVSDEDQMPVDIPVDLPIEVVVVQQPDDVKESDLSVNTKRLYEKFDPCRIRLLRARNIRRGFEKEGMELQRPERIYDVPDVWCNSLKHQDSTGSVARETNTPPVPNTKPRSVHPVSPQPRPRLAAPQPTSNDHSQTYRPLVLHTNVLSKSQYANPSQQQPPVRTNANTGTGTLTTASSGGKVTTGGRKSPKQQSPLSSPTPADMELVVARVEVLEREVYALRSEIAKLRAQVTSSDSKPNGLTLPEDKKSSTTKRQNIEHLKTLSTKQVAELLQHMNLSQYQKTFLKEHTSGDVLSSCTKEMLQVELGVSSKIHCMRLLKVISGETSATSLQNLVV